MKKEKRIILMAVVVLLVAVFAAVNLINRPAVYDPEETSKYSLQYVTPKAGLLSMDPGMSSAQKVGESGDLQLFYDPSIPGLCLRNVASGYVWNSYVSTEQMPDYAGVANLRQLCSATLINTDSDNTMMVNHVATKCDITYQGLENGLAIQYAFPEQGLSFTMQVWLEQGRMWVRLPVDEIVESEPFHLLSIDVLQFFGAATNKEDGYILFPDGAGTIYPFDSNYSPLSSPITLDVYSDRITDVDTLLENQQKGIHAVKMPFYGVRRGENAYIAYMADGAQQRCLWHPTGI